MKTPKEKAKELLEKMNVIHYTKLGGKNSESKGLPVSMHDDQIKHCALIAVDEISRVCPYIDSKVRDTEDQLAAFNFQFVSYWDKVKQEILKL